jgi:hypothetical protein
MEAYRTVDQTIRPDNTGPKRFNQVVVAVRARQVTAPRKSENKGLSGRIQVTQTSEGCSDAAILPLMRCFIARDNRISLRFQERHDSGFSLANCMHSQRNHTNNGSITRYSKRTEQHAKVAVYRTAIAYFHR